MSKYIDANKVVTEIERRIERLKKLKENDFTDGSIDAYKGILILIDSLQQEQPECIYGRTFKEREKYCKFCSAVCEVRVEQEQPEVDLEKFTEKIKTFQGRYKHPESISIKGAMTFMARMFYQYPNVARKWYDSLPKATMD